MLTMKIQLLNGKCSKLGLYISMIYPVIFLYILNTPIPSQSQIAKGANKYLGNITTLGQVGTDFQNYWNEIAGENEFQWMTIENQRDVMTWGKADQIALFARTNKIVWKVGPLITSGSYQAWLASLSNSDALDEIGEWMDAVALKYPDATMIDVVREGYPGHMPPAYRKALGGEGATGFDWIIKAFKMARERWPNAILLYNDYNNIEKSAEINWTMNLIDSMKKAGVCPDAIGCEAHEAYKLPSSTVKSDIDLLATTGLPILITEYDIDIMNDTVQDSIMREQFPIFWNHPKIAGITYWGYVLGKTWRQGTGLLTQAGKERPALTWLKEYVKNNPAPPNDFPKLFVSGHVNVNLQKGFTMVEKNKQSKMKNSSPDVFDIQGRTIGLQQAVNLIQEFKYPAGIYVIKNSNDFANRLNVGH